MDFALINKSDFAHVNIDDNIVFSSMMRDHLEQLKNILARLKEFGLKAKPSKCKVQKKVNVHLSRTHIWSWTGGPDVWSLIDLVGYYKKFIRDFASNSTALQDMDWKTAQMHWTDQMEKEFNYTKKSMSFTPMRTISTQRDQFILQMDWMLVKLEQRQS